MNITKWLFNHWQRKAVAFTAALVLWLFLNQSIAETKVIPNVPIRVINLPRDKTVSGLLPNGILKKRISLTLRGSRDVIQALEPGDIEVVIDASMIDRDDWIVRITKKNLVSLNPNLDFSHNITYVFHNEFVLKMSNVITAKVPVTITKPIGEPPGGYQFLDLWPYSFTQTLSGPAEEVLSLKAKGIKVTFDLSRISVEELDKIRKQSGSDEVSYPVPKSWMRLRIPYNSVTEEFNDPNVQEIYLNFLHRDFLPIEKNVPIRVFYPLEFSYQINPLTYSLSTSSKVEKKNGIHIFTFPLYVKDVSRTFLNVIRDNLEITLVAAPPQQRDVLEWSIEIIDPEELEDTYVAYMIANEPKSRNELSAALIKQRDEGLRNRFKHYKQETFFWVTPHQKLSLETVLEDHHIKVK